MIRARIRFRREENRTITLDSVTIDGDRRIYKKFITVDGLDYHFVMAKHSYYIAYYKAIGEEGRGNAIFGITAFSPIDLLNEMLGELKEKGLLE